MTVLHKKEGGKGLFFVGEEDNMVAQMTYTATSDDKMLIDHTEVDDELRGQNIGYQLVQAGVEYARSHHLKIIPVCPFARAIIEKKPDFKDVLEE